MLYLIFDGLACIQFNLLLRLQLWNIQTKRKYWKWDSMKAFMIILLLLTFMKGASRARSLSFGNAFSQISLTSHQIVFSISCYSKEYFFIFDSMEEPSITDVDGSQQLKRRWLMPLLAFIKLLLKHWKSSTDNVSNVLISDSFFLLQYIL